MLIDEAETVDDTRARACAGQGGGRGDPAHLHTMSEGARRHAGQVGGHDGGSPDQVATATAAADGSRRTAGAPRHRERVILGWARAASPATSSSALAAISSRVPIVVCKGYEPPNFTGPARCASRSRSPGRRKRRWEAAQLAYEGRRQHGGSSRPTASCPLLADEWDVPLIGVPRDHPGGARALGALLVPMLAVLEDVGLFPGARE